MDSLSKYILVIVVKEVSDAETEGCEYTLVSRERHKYSQGNEPGVRVETFSQKL